MCTSQNLLTWMNVKDIEIATSYGLSLSVYKKDIEHTVEMKARQCVNGLSLAYASAIHINTTGANYPDTRT